MKVPFNDLKAQYRTIKPEVDAAISEVVESCAYIGGPYLESFEKAFADYCETEHAVGVASGTAALHLAMVAMGIGPGDEVITTPFTFIATTEAISQTGASIKFVDCCEQDGNLDSRLLDAAITDRTKLIIPVHLFGQPVRMDEILEIAEGRDVPVMEDSAQAVGAYYRGRRAGSLAKAACFSFYPGKNLGAYGDGGAVTTNDSELAERMRLLRDHGRTTKYEHSVEGYNYRLDALHAAVLEVKLRSLEHWTEMRRKFAKQYDEMFEGTEVRPLKERDEDIRHVYHLYVARVADREALLPLLAERGVGAGVHYPLPLHLQPAYAHLGLGPGSFPASEALGKEVISLPLYAEMDERAPEYVASVLKELVGART